MPSFRNELSINDQEIAAALVGEERRQQDGVELIPSENCTYPEVLELLGSVFTNEYSEGLLTAIHDAVMALPPDERCDRAKVNEAVRDGFKLGPPRSAGTDDR